MLDHSERRLHSLGKVMRAGETVQSAELEVLPDAAKFAFRGRLSVATAAASSFGVQFPLKACRFATRGNRAVYWLGPDEWLLVGSGEQPGQLYADLSAATAQHSCSLVDVSHQSDTFALRGRHAAYVLNHGCPLDLSIGAFPVGMCTRTIIGKASVVLSRSQIDSFEIDVWRSFAPYVWRLLDEARRELS